MKKKIKNMVMNKRVLFCYNNVVYIQGGPAILGKSNIQVT